jgi:hypothetical protein
LGIRVNVWGAWIAVLIGIAIIVVQSRRHTGLEPSPYLDGREWKPEAGVDSEDVYTDSEDDSNEAAVLAGAPGSTDATSESAAKP